MTPERIKELRAIIAAATPGPWLTDFGDFCYAVNDFGTNRMQFFIDGGNIEQGIDGKKRTPKEELRANVSLAQAARNDIPQALDTIEAQQRRIEDLEAALKPFADGGNDPYWDNLPDEHRIYLDGADFPFDLGDIRTACTALQPKAIAAKEG